jgi:hypothetical protein
VNDLVLVLAVAVITYASRLAFLLRPRQTPAGALGRFLDVFPLALFIVIATAGLAAPAGTPDVTPALAAAIGGAAGGMLFRRNLWGVLTLGALAFYLTRALFG